MLAIRSGKKWENPKSVSYDNPLKITEMRSLGQRKQFLVRPKDDRLNNDGVVYSIPCECGKVLETGTPMQDRIKEHERDIRLVRIQTSTVSEHANNNGHNPLWNEVKFIDRDRHWYTGRVKAIQIRPPKQHQQGKWNRNFRSMDGHDHETEQQNSEDRNTPIKAAENQPITAEHAV